MSRRPRGPTGAVVGAALVMGVLGSASAVRAQSTPAGETAAYGDGTTALHEAAEAGDLTRTRALIEAGADVDATTRLGAYTPLHLAAAAGQGATVRALLSGGADPNSTTATGGVVALHFAAAAGSVEAVRALLEAGAAVDPRESERGQTPLIFAVARNRTAAVRALIDAGADIEAATFVVAVPELQAASSASARVRSQVLDSLAEVAGLDPVMFKPTAAQVELAVRRANEVEQAARRGPTEGP